MNALKIVLSVFGLLAEAAIGLIGIYVIFNERNSINQAAAGSFFIMLVAWVFSMIWCFNNTLDACKLEPVEDDEDDLISRTKQWSKERKI